MIVELDEDELALLREALDSHAYWQVSDPNYRDSGNIRDPGSDDPEARDALAEIDRLDAKLARMYAAE